MAMKWQANGCKHLKLFIFINNAGEAFYSANAFCLSLGHVLAHHLSPAACLSAPVHLSLSLSHTLALPERIFNSGQQVQTFFLLNAKIIRITQASRRHGFWFGLVFVINGKLYTRKQTHTHAHCIPESRITSKML